MFIIATNIGLGQTFQDVTTQLGVLDGFGLLTSFGTDKPGGGLSFADFNQDGYDDLTVSTRAGTMIHFYQNNGGNSFTRIAPLTNNTCNSKQIIWADLDNDGDKDLFVSCHDDQSRVYENLGSLTLVDRTFRSGILEDDGYEAMTVSLGDLDVDGYLDIVTGEYSNLTSEYREKVYHNNGDFTFDDITTTVGIKQIGSPTLSISFQDINHDLLPDLLISEDKLWENLMYKNVGNNILQDISVSSGANVVLDAMNSSAGDIDGDGDLDLYITNGISGNALLRNNGNETFTNITPASGTSMNRVSWAASFLDIENDGDHDLYVSSSDINDNTNALFVSDGNGTFTEPLLSSGGLGGNDQDKSYCNIRGDFNNDGLEDIAVSNLDDAQIKIWQNNNSVGNNWIKVNLDGVVSNKDGIGAWVTAHSNGNIYTRYTNSGDGYMGQNSDNVLIGIGQNSQIDSLVIEWPSGIVDPFITPSLNQLITIVEGSSPNSYTQAVGPVDPELTDPNLSVARNWMELLLESIRNDYARPTIHARNLFHGSVVMFDAWAAYQSISFPYFLGQTVDGYTCAFSGIPAPTDIEAAREEAISFAMYRLLRHRFQNSPSSALMYNQYDKYMDALGYDKQDLGVNYSSGNPSELGNYLAQEIINFGLQDGSNEQNDYANQFYQPVNDSLVMDFEGNPNLDDFNQWQPLTLQVFIDQAGNEIPINTPDFLSPEWGSVSNFALQPSDLSTYTRNGNTYEVYCDPGPPVLIDTLAGSLDTDLYQWGFSLVSIWSSHLDANNNTMWDISPASIGNIQSYPTDPNDYPDFYDQINGGDSSTGHVINPSTNAPYVPQIVKRADYARVLAEFWADGPDSETPPGHWFTLLNHVSDHPSFVKQYKGTGAVLNDLEWDVKAYFSLGGPMHDAAVSAWGIKGWYDYIRPVSAIRGMARLGQSSNSSLPSYHKGGFPLVTGYIELVNAGDPLAGNNNEHVGKIKLYTWKGPYYINDSYIDEAGSDWILAENWWPYQRPSFVTPPFAGYVSGHSTFSRAAAEVMTLLTGDAFFPDGMGQFSATKNEFLVFEDGPSEDIILQWATYRDASDQCSLSRIWGGIHPPVDDIPGRLIGAKIGVQGFDLAEYYIVGLQTNCANGILVENGNPIPNPLYEAGAIISMGHVISPDVTFEASDSILLEVNFEVSLGAQFIAEIVGCP